MEMEKLKTREEPLLPIYEVEAEIVRSLQAERRLIISAPTGSGKSTQTPQILLRHGFLKSGQAVILQPRRLATRMLASRVAKELGVTLGMEVGYQIRFENVSSEKTVIRYVTEGVLLRQMLGDPALRGVSVLIFDEFHERHLYGDITLAQALDLQESRRPDLRVIVMSATLDLPRLEEYMAPCQVVRSEGRVYPVEVQYARAPAYLDRRPVWEQAADAFRSQIRSGGKGDALVFMPGSFEIHQTMEALRHTPEAKGFMLLPLHGELAPAEQDAAVNLQDHPKVVVSTNVAETSLTIEGVRLVIDSGLARIPRYDPYRGINTLLVEKISRASADQRAGRAGRTAPGHCLRLWSEREHFDRPLQETPEVKRLDLSEVILTLKAAGVQDLRRFRWLQPPEEQALAHAEELLADLGALDKQGTISDLGRKMLAFPLHPRYSRMLLAAQEFGCVYQAALIAALTQGRDLLLRSAGRETVSFREEILGEKASSDFWILMRAWSYAAQNQFRLEACQRAGIHGVTARQVGPLLQNFLRIAEREGLAVESGEVKEEDLQKCILSGFSDRVARRVDQGTLRCILAHGRRGVLARESVVQHSLLLVAAEAREVQGKESTVNTLLSLATAIELDWLREMFPEDFRSDLRVFYDPSARRVYAEEQALFRDLAVDTRKVEPPPLEPAAQLLAREVHAGRLALPDWDHSLEQWILRLNLLSSWVPELQLPPLTDEDRLHLIEQACHGAFGYKEIKERPVKHLVKSWLNSAQQLLLDKQAPERLELANGRKPKVIYKLEGPPHIALRVQELYEVKSTPRIAMGRIPVLVHILAPNMRPVQITQDLEGFWREHYPKVKQELQRKYPKHEWR
jgi:ATP-dependent helicase HrpB